MHFTGLKVGDVNGSASPAFAGQTEERWQGMWPVSMRDQAFRPGDRVETVVSADWASLAGAQFTITFDPQILDLQRTEPLAAGISAAHFALKPGGKNCFTFCAENPANLRSAYPKEKATGAALFKAVFRARAAGQLSGALCTGLSPTPPAAFLPDGTALRPFINWENTAAATLQVQTYPNPFGLDGCWFKIQGKQQAETQVRIFNSKGQIIYEMATSQPLFHVPATYFEQNGVYWYDIRQGKLQSSGKILFNGK